MTELLAELEAIRTLSDRLADEIIRLRRHVDRAERRLRAPLWSGTVRDDDDGGD